MKPILFRGASIWDGSGADAFPGDVLVEGKPNQKPLQENRSALQ